jgi:hypothetical protein
MDDAAEHDMAVAHTRVSMLHLLHMLASSYACPGRRVDKLTAMIDAGLSSYRRLHGQSDGVWPTPDQTAS